MAEDQGALESELAKMKSASEPTTALTGIEKPGATVKGKQKAVAEPSASAEDDRARKLGEKSTGEATEADKSGKGTSKNTFASMFKKTKKSDGQPAAALAGEETGASAENDEFTKPDKKVKGEATETSVSRKDMSKQTFASRFKQSKNSDAQSAPAASSAEPSASTKEVQTSKDQADATPVVEKQTTELDKSKDKFGGLFKRPRTKKDDQLSQEIEAATLAVGNLNAVATKAVEDIKRGVVPQIMVGEGPMSEEDQENAYKRYEELLKSGGDSLATIISAEKFRVMDAIAKLPSGRDHSMSEDTVLVVKPGSRAEHSLSSDAVVSNAKQTPVHSLEQDKVINAQPSKRGAHRLSTDAMVPMRVATPSHDIDTDPMVSGTNQLFSHELLDDKRVLRPKSPQPRSHSLEQDQKLAKSHAQRKAHDLHSDTVVVAPQPRSAHDLHSDDVVASGGPARKEHYMAHDVRILSPSGAVRDPHIIEDDEVIKENAVFRKSPIPEVMMGASSSSSGGGSSYPNNPMASLNASLQQAGQAMEQLKQMGVGPPSKDHTTGRPGMNSNTGGGSFWGKMFKRGGGAETETPAAS